MIVTDPLIKLDETIDKLTGIGDKAADVAREIADVVRTLEEDIIPALMDTEADAWASEHDDDEPIDEGGDDE